MSAFERTVDQSFTYGSVISRRRACEKILSVIAMLPENERSLADRQRIETEHLQDALEKQISVMDTAPDDGQAVEKVGTWIQRCTRHILEGLLSQDGVDRLYDISECIDPAVQQLVSRKLEEFYAAITSFTDQEEQQLGDEGGRIDELPESDEPVKSTFPSPLDVLSHSINPKPTFQHRADVQKPNEGRFLRKPDKNAILEYFENLSEPVLIKELVQYFFGRPSLPKEVFNAFRAELNRLEAAGFIHSLSGRRYQRSRQKGDQSGGHDDAVASGLSPVSKRVLSETADLDTKLAAAGIRSPTKLGGVSSVNHRTARTGSRRRK
jgi:hypothetical protein